MQGSASQAGFYYQNNIAALKIIECLFFNSDITHIELENYDKGNHIDDVIIHKSNKIEYYQVKWSNDGEQVYSLYNLLTADEGKMSLFKQLAEGYTSVKSNGKDFVITLFTTKKESGQKRPSQGVDHGLKEIRNKVFEVIKNSATRYDQIPNLSGYQNTVEKIRTECSLNEDDFNDFIQKLDFKFSQEPIEQIQSAIRFRLKRLGLEENLFEKLLDKVVKWSISGEKITKGVVLKQLGISNRFEDKISHFFKVVDDKYYVQNDDLQTKLNTSLSELEGGYIFIKGLPGIGKSTALTKFKESHPDVTLAYYCFIPDARSNFGELRHQAHYFLKSLCISIENQFPEIDLPNKYSNRYDEKLASYISKLGTIDRKTIFIIDGLDHVHRNINIQEDSLLSKIKGKLPKNVFFILSSQYKAVLSSSVTLEIDSDTRRHITVSKFSQLQIQQFLKNKGIEADNILNQVEKISSGIPLYLHYISELLLKIEESYYEQTLKELPDLNDGKIDSYHQYLYQKIEDNESVKWMLAVLAYRKENSTVDAIVQILELVGEKKTATDVINVLNNFSHLLKISNGRGYSIFHNSFREFILSKTVDLKDKFNSALAAYYEKVPFSDEAYRNYFNHLYEIEEYDKIIISTTLDWVKSAWYNYRTVDEIKNNLNIAIDACVETLSLSSFIRIAFIKAQFLKLSWNLENSNIDFSTLLLKGGEFANSLRSIWDGDFVLVNKSYFCYYLSQYYSQTGDLLPKNILYQGFSKLLLERDTDNTTLEFKTRALVFENIKVLFDEIDSVKWENSDSDRVDYYKENFSDEENTQVNLKIKKDVVDYLRKHKKYDRLNQLITSLTKEDPIYLDCQLALIELLFSSDKQSAKTLLKEIDYEKISSEDYLKLIILSSDYLTNFEIQKLIPERSLSLPLIHENVIEKGYMEYKIHEEVIILFDQLKPIWIFEPEKVTQLMLRVSTLSNPAKNLYSSVFLLSEFWHKNRISDLTEDAKIGLVKQSIDELCVPPEKEYRKVGYGLFDMNNDDIFIARSIKKLYRNIFNLSIKTLSIEELKELVNYWLTVEKKENKYRHYAIGLVIAEELNNIQDMNLSDSIREVIKRSEEIVRYEEETATLLNYLGEIASVYGTCKFKDDFKRVYNQLIEVAFGLGYKRDYQSINIIAPLEITHDTDPDQTLKKLSDIFHIQDNLADVGRSRMNHICLSYLISFVLKHYPQLAFELIEKEESNLWRAEALDIILEPLIKNASIDELHLYFTVIKTLPRWENGGTRDNHFLSLSIVMVKRAVELNDSVFLERTLKEIKYNTLVELELIEELEKFSEVLQKKGIDYTSYHLPVPSMKIKSSENKQKTSQYQKFNIQYSPPEYDVLIEQFQSDYSLFESTIQANFETCLRNRKNQTLRNEYYRSKSIFEKFFQSLPDDIQTSLSNVEKQIIRHYLAFKQKVVDADINPILTTGKLEQHFDEFIQSISSLFPNKSLKIFIEMEFDKSKWLDSILRFINEHKTYLFSQVISEKNVYKLVKETPLLQVDNLITFINNWTSDKTKSICLLMVANRLVPLDSKKAKKILTEVMEDDTHNHLFPDRYDSKKLDFDILESILRIDKEFGKKFTLKSYLSQKGKYGDSLIESLDKLLRFQKYFNDGKVQETFYEANLQYNKELVKGLSKKENNYKFIEKHNEVLPFSEVIIKYLVGLFNYPVVKIRELALQSMFDLIDQNSEYLKSLIKYGVEKGTDNQVEHSLIILHAISRKQPKILFAYKKDLFSLSNRKHFNILESSKELLLYLNNIDSKFLNSDEINIINAYNTESPIILNSLSIVDDQRKHQFLYSRYQRNLLSSLNQNENDNSEIQKDVCADLMSKGWNDYDFEKEGNVHKRYNINSNFDIIEIQSPYYDEVKSSLNRVYHSKIKRGCFESFFIKKEAPNFRLYDPSKLLFRIQPKPEYIDWLPNISEEEFVSYTDFDGLIHNFVNREPEYITLAEFGNQRPKKEHSENQFTCYFEIYAYLKKNGFDDSTMENRSKKVVPYLQSKNRYSFELPSGDVSTSFPVQNIKPLLEISNNNYRGEIDLINTNLLSDIFKDFGIEKKNLLEILVNEDDNYPIKALRWQNAYTSGTGRRRYKPTSEGFTLKIKKELFQKYLSDNNLVLCYDISLRRSTTKYRSESYMKWYDKNCKHEVS